MCSLIQNAGTRALELADPVDQGEKHRRAEAMISVSARKHKAFASRYVGTVRPVLLEHSMPGHPLGGFTDNYLRVRAQVDPSLDNKVVDMRLVRLLDDGETFDAELI